MVNKFRTLRADEIDCRVSQIASNYCTILLYKDARVDMNILDESVGCLNWQKHYLRDNANCIVSIWDEEKKQWIEKEDTGTESFSEAEKGLASDSFKRACFNFGIGRELYSAPSIFILPNKEMIAKGKESEFYLNDKGKYETKTRFWVEYIDYDDNRRIVDLVIRDNKNHIRFSKLKPETEKDFNDITMKLNKLIETHEEKDNKFDRENLYKKYGASSQAELTIEQQKAMIEELERE